MKSRKIKSIKTHNKKNKTKKQKQRQKNRVFMLVVQKKIMN